MALVYFRGGLRLELRSKPKRSAVVFGGARQKREVSVYHILRRCSFTVLRTELCAENNLVTLCEVLRSVTTLIPIHS